MLKIDTIPDQVLGDIACAMGYGEEPELTLAQCRLAIEKMTANQAFKLWCQWHGLLGSLPEQVLDTVFYIKSAEV